MADPLDSFAVWAGQQLGPDVEEETPGWRGTFRAPAVHLHLGGVWGTSTARTDSQGVRHPAVYLKLIAGVVGTGPVYHVLEGICDADVARQWAEVLTKCAERAEIDLEAGEVS